jgi:hypothetical protein
MYADVPFEERTLEAHQAFKDSKRERTFSFDDKVTVVPATATEVGRGALPPVDTVTMLSIKNRTNTMEVAGARLKKIFRHLTKAFKNHRSMEKTAFNI